MVAALAICSASRAAPATVCAVPPGPHIPSVGARLAAAIAGTANRNSPSNNAPAAVIAAVRLTLLIDGAPYPARASLV